MEGGELLTVLLAELEGLETPLACRDVQDRDDAGCRYQVVDGPVVGVAALSVERVLHSFFEAAEEEGRGDVGGD